MYISDIFGKQSFPLISLNWRSIKEALLWNAGKPFFTIAKWQTFSWTAQLKIIRKYIHRASQSLLTAANEHVQHTAAAPPTQPPPTWPRVPLGNLDPRRLSGGTSPTVVTAPPPLKHLFRKRTLIFCDFTFGPSSVIRCGPARTPRPQVSAPKGVWEEPRWSAKFVWSSVFVRFKSVTPYFAMVC